MTEKTYTMDRTKKRLENLYRVIEWLLKHWRHFPDNLYKLVNGNFEEFNIREFLWDLIRQDFANIITPAQLWRVLAEKADGLALIDDETGLVRDMILAKDPKEIAKTANAWDLEALQQALEQGLINQDRVEQIIKALKKT